MGPGAVAPAAINNAVGMKKTQVAADASPSDALDWTAKRAQEKAIGRNLRVFEWEGQRGSHT